MSWRTSGLRVTIPWPRGRKSLPTILSRRVSPTPEELEKADTRLENGGFSRRLTANLDATQSMSHYEIRVKKYIPQPTEAYPAPRL